MKTTLKDTRLQFRRKVIAHSGNVWAIDAKFNRATRELKVSRVEGDVTNPAALKAALTHFVSTIAA